MKTENEGGERRYKEEQSDEVEEGGERSWNRRDKRGRDRGVGVDWKGILGRRKMDRGLNRLVRK